jgi:predicted CXXCH cytochrome family protein
MRNLMKSLLVVALMVPALASATITLSKHNLSTGGSGIVKNVTTNQVCVFCHTPHRAAATVLLWNRNTTLAATGWAVGNTSNGTPLPQQANLQSASLVCLSCHDGVNALGSLTNVNGASATYLFTGNADVSAGGVLTNTGYAYIGTNLNKNHPISIPYGGQGAYAAATAGSKTVAGDFFAAQATCIGSSYCAGGTNGNLIPLYGTNGNLGVECSSCHDPHSTVNSFFLRVSTSASALCVACHNK